MWLDSLVQGAAQRLFHLVVTFAAFWPHVILSDCRNPVAADREDFHLKKVPVEFGSTLAAGGGVELMRPRQD